MMAAILDSAILHIQTLHIIGFWLNFHDGSSNTLSLHSAIWLKLIQSDTN